MPVCASCASEAAEGSLRPGIAASLLVTSLAGMLLLAYVFGEFSLLGQSQMPKSPQVLADRARAIIHEIGYEEPPEDWDY